MELRPPFRHDIDPVIMLEPPSTARYFVRERRRPHGIRSPMFSPQLVEGSDLSKHHRSVPHSINEAKDKEDQPTPRTYRAAGVQLCGDLQAVKINLGARARGGTLACRWPQEPAL